MKLAPDVPVQLEESPNGGRYYMSLVDDLLEQRVQDPARLQNFRTICRHLSEWDQGDTGAGLDTYADPVQGVRDPHHHLTSPLADLSPYFPWDEPQTGQKDQSGFGTEAGTGITSRSTAVLARAR